MDTEKKVKIETLKQMKYKCLLRGTLVAFVEHTCALYGRLIDDNCKKDVKDIVQKNVGMFEHTDFKSYLGSGYARL